MFLVFGKNVIAWVGLPPAHSSVLYYVGPMGWPTPVIWDHGYEAQTYPPLGHFRPLLPPVSNFHKDRFSFYRSIPGKLTCKPRACKNLAKSTLSGFRRV